MTGGRERLRREVRDFVLRVGMAGGGILGLLWMVNTWPSSASACRQKVEASEQIGRCVSDTLIELLVPGLAKFAAGMFGGAIVAILLVTFLPGLRRPRASRFDR